MTLVVVKGFIVERSLSHKIFEVSFTDEFAGEKLVVYSNGTEEHSFGSALLQISNFVKLCVDEKQGDESHESIYASPNSRKKPDITFSKHCYYSAYISLFNVLKQQ